MRCKSPQKASGAPEDAPEVPFQFPNESYLFFLAFFFAAILFSSELLDFRASIAGGARIQSPCIESLNYLVKRKVNVDDEKMMRKGNFESRSGIKS